MTSRSENIPTTAPFWSTGSAPIRLFASSDTASPTLAETSQEMISVPARLAIILAISIAHHLQPGWRMPPFREKRESARSRRADLLRPTRAQPQFLHRLTADQMPLDNPFERVLGAGMVPDAVGPDHGDGSMRADLQAIGLGSLDAAALFSARVDTGRADEVQFGEPPFEEFPRSFPLLAPAAVLLLARGAEEDVPPDRLAADPAKGNRGGFQIRSLRHKSIQAR